MRPFLARHPGIAPAGPERAAFLWAAGIVGAYSFTLGRERYQVKGHTGMFWFSRTLALPGEKRYWQVPKFTLGCASAAS